MTKVRERSITVCSACFRASCWHGEFMCEKSRSAGTVEKSESELAALGVEHPSYYAKDRVEKICGSTKYVPI